MAENQPSQLSDYVEKLLPYAEIHGPIHVNVATEDGAGIVPLVQDGQIMPSDEIKFTSADNGLAPIRHYTLDGLVHTKYTSIFGFYVKEGENVIVEGMSRPIGGLYGVIVNEDEIRFFNPKNPSRKLPREFEEALTQSFIGCYIRVNVSQPKGKKILEGLNKDQVSALNYHILKYSIQK